MIFDCTECFYNKQQGYILCDNHKPVARPMNRKYDELYPDCNTDVFPILGKDVWKLSAWGAMPLPFEEWAKSEISFRERSDLPLCNIFEENIKQISKTQFIPEDTQRMLSTLRRSDEALASYDFNGSFETDGNFEWQINKIAFSAFLSNWTHFPNDKIENLFIDIIKCIELKRIS